MGFTTEIRKFDRTYLENVLAFLEIIEDPKNEKILDIIKNEKITLTDLSKKMNLSKPSVHERLKKLEKEGIISFKEIKHSQGNQKIIVPAGKKTETIFKKSLLHLRNEIDELL